MSDKEDRAGRPSKRDLIVSAARKLFLDSGYGAVSMDAIAAEAGVSKRTVYSHFQNKETLFGAVIGDMCAAMGGPNSTDLAADRSPEEVLTAYGRQILKVVLDPEALSVFRVVLAESPQFPELSQMFCSTGPDPMCNFLSSYLAELNAAGVLDVGDPDTAAKQFINMVKGPYFTALLFGVGPRPTQEEAERSLQQAVSIFLKGARKE
ncbi:MAG: TetR/AcrR family transcriptional regulator [Proteobacteria bacterium]|nr:TetR/AcrR family transcriptional regulator [Pseudomonadota bacterium]